MKHTFSYNRGYIVLYAVILELKGKEIVEYS